jgi:GT2 family glycosyltransferase
MSEVDLTICQECGINPAVYGDGLTWALCSKCKRLKDADEGVTEEQEPVGQQGFEHKIQEGLTSIIIPVYILNYSLLHYTGNCIGSVREHTPEGHYEIVVVDNGSPMKPPSPDSYYAQKVIVNQENLGVTKAWNQGIRASVGEYIVLLNNDVQVFDHWLDDMLMGLEAYDLVMAHPMYSMTEPFARATEAAEVRAGKKKLDPIKTDFSCVAFKRSLLDELGLFDQQFFNYCSDLDLFKRMDQAGKKYKVFDVATSHLSDATGMLIKTTPQIMEKDKAAFAEKWKDVPSVDPVEEVSEVKKSDLLFRVINGGDPLYYLTNNKMYRIKNPETLKALGFDFGQEQNITREEFNTFERGGEISREDIYQIIQHEEKS